MLCVYWHKTKIMTVKTKTVIIWCPNCGKGEEAEVRESIPFNTYLHDCKECNYTIMESEWNVFDPDFGDHVLIEQKRHGVENEIYLHKVIRRLESNTFVDVPV